MLKASVPLFLLLFYVYIIVVPYYCESEECDILSNNSKEVFEGGIKTATDYSGVVLHSRLTFVSLPTSVVLPEYVPGVGNLL